jgi:hypothetical protein
MKRFAIWGLLCFLCLLMASTLAMAQTATTGQITGTVKDPSGAVIAGAKLTLTSAAGEQREATTSAEGFYRFVLLPPGAYKLVIAAPGFKTATFDNVTVRITQSTDVSPSLALPTAAEAVNVSAEPPLIELDKATAGRVIGENAIAQAPLPTRNFQQLLALSPGAVSGLSNNTELGRGDANIFVNGQRATSNNVVVDGTGVNSPGTNSTPNISVPSPDAIQEFIVQTSMYDATQGRNAGGNVAVVTKSGTNAFHGDVFEFLRNNKLNANDFFLNQKGVPRPRLTRNQFGGTLGGPLVKDKTFFFISYQGTRERNGASLSNSLSFPFLPAGLTDDRSDTAINNLALAYGLPSAFVHSITRNMLKAKLPNGRYMIPSAAASSLPATTLVSSPQSMISKFQEDQFNVNIDQNFGQKNKLSGKFFYSADPQSQGVGTFVGANVMQLPGFGTEIEFQNRVFSLSDTHIFSPSLINQARVGYSRINGPSHPVEPFQNSDFGINNPLCTAGDSRFCGLSTIYVANMFTIGGYSLADQRSTTETFEYGDMVSYTKGRHSLRFGGDVVRYRVNFFFNFFSRGQMQFSSFKNFLMGVPDYGLLGNGIRDRHYRATDFDLYLQDDFRVAPQFTLNAGVRLARNGGISDVNNRLVNFDPAAFATNSFPCSVAAPCTKGFTNVTGTLNPNDWNVAPRLGFSWKPVAASNFVVRGGIGVYFDRFSTRVANLQIFDYPYDIVGLSAPFIPATALQFFANPFPDLSKVTFPVNPATIPSPVPYYASGVPLPGTSTAISGLYVNKDFRTPYVYQYNLGVQYEVAKDWLVELGYVGSTGHKLINIYTFSQGATGTAPYLTAYGFTNNKVLNGFQQAETNANSNYNSLQTSVTKRFSNGLQFLASYTWSKAIDDISGAPANEFVALPGDQQGLAVNRAVSDFNRPHRFVFSGLYDLPKFYKGDSRIAKRVINEWQLSTVMAFQSGAPFTVACTSGSATYNRADLVSGVDYHVSGSVADRLGGYFNRNAFATTCTNAAPYGTSPRNFIYGPGQKNVDFSVVKFIPVTERVNMQFRTEFFNAFNFVNFANPISSYTTGVAGSYALLGNITSTASGPRVIQFALKLSF